MDAPLLARAPGRVNLIGEHVDYVGGPVLPVPLPWGTSVHGERGGQRVVLTCEAFAGRWELALDGTPLSVASGGGDGAGRARDDDDEWGRLAAALVAALRPPVGLCAHVSGDLPVGAGLSSSASFLVALARALGHDGTPVELARLVQRLEHEVRGVPCGLMDPLVIAAGRPGAALHIDCTTGDHHAVPWPTGLDLLLVDSGVRRRLSSGVYAERRAEVERALAAVAVTAGEVTSAVDIEAELARLDDPLLRRRARHVLGECRRVGQVEAALRAGDGPRVGALLDAGQASLSADMQVSTPGIDALAHDLRRRAGVLGARLSGAGFGGFLVVVAEPGTDTSGWPRPARRVLDARVDPAGH